MAPDDEVESLEVEELEVGGEIVDAYGNSWAVPSDNVGLEYNLTNPMDFPKRDPRFHYQWVRDDQLQAYIAVGHVPVTRADAGFNPVLVKEYGVGADSYLRAGGMTLVKIPKVYADRLQKASEMEAKAAVEVLGPTPKMVEDAKKAGLRVSSQAKVQRSDKLTQ